MPPQDQSTEPTPPPSACLRGSIKVTATIAIACIALAALSYAWNAFGPGIDRRALVGGGLAGLAAVAFVLGRGLKPRVGRNSPADIETRGAILTRAAAWIALGQPPRQAVFIEYRFNQLSVFSASLLVGDSLLTVRSYVQDKGATGWVGAEAHVAASIQQDKPAGTPAQ